MIDEPFQQCHFAYFCIADQAVAKAGWYVCWRMETLKGEKLDWKVKFGPFKNQVIALEAKRETFKDINKPKRLEAKVFKLTKAKPKPKD